MREPPQKSISRSVTVHGKSQHKNQKKAITKYQKLLLKNNENKAPPEK
jgi:hypothetical protein